MLVDDTITIHVRIEVDIKQSSLYDSWKETGFVGLRNQGGVFFVRFCIIANAASPLSIFEEHRIWKVAV